MATTNTDPNIGTALVINKREQALVCDFCQRLIIKPGDTYAADFINCCLDCDKSLPCLGKDCKEQPLDNHSYCAKHQDESGEVCGCGKTIHIGTIQEAPETQPQRSWRLRPAQDAQEPTRWTAVVTFQDGKDLVGVVAIQGQPGVLETAVEQKLIQQASEILAEDWNSQAVECGEPDKADYTAENVARGLEIAVNIRPIYASR